MISVSYQSSNKISNEYQKSSTIVLHIKLANMAVKNALYIYIYIYNSCDQKIQILPWVMRSKLIFFIRFKRVVFSRNEKESAK